MLALPFALALEERLARREVLVAIVGDASAGLPLAWAFAGKRLRTRFRPAGEQGTEVFDIAILCVPAPTNGDSEAHRSRIASAAEQIAAHLRPGNMVVLWGAGDPGTTVEVLRPILERSGLRVGKEIFLAFGPIGSKTAGARPGSREAPMTLHGADRLSARVAVRLFQGAP